MCRHDGDHPERLRLRRMYAGVQVRELLRGTRLFQKLLAQRAQVAGQFARRYLCLAHEVVEMLRQRLNALGVAKCQVVLADVDHR